MSTPERRHRRHPFNGSPEDCWYCGRDAARCQSKQSFDEWDAINEAHAINVETDWREPMRAYWCDLCGRYHLTRANTPRKARRIERQGRRRLERERLTDDSSR